MIKQLHVVVLVFDEIQNVTFTHVKGLWQVDD